MKFSNEAKLCELGRRLDQSWHRHQQVDTSGNRLWQSAVKRDSIFRGV